jgi:hypothetical protein
MRTFLPLSCLTVRYNKSFVETGQGHPKVGKTDHLSYSPKVSQQIDTSVFSTGYVSLRAAYVDVLSVEWTQMKYTQRAIPCPKNYLSNVPTPPKSSASRSNYKLCRKKMKAQLHPSRPPLLPTLMRFQPKKRQQSLKLKETALVRSSARQPLDTKQAAFLKDYCYTKSGLNTVCKRLYST